MGQRGRREQRHAELVAQLADVRAKQQALAIDAQSFVRDPAAPEKVAAHGALCELLLLTPDVVALGVQTGGVVERVANANDVAEKMTREVRRIDVIQSRMRACLAQSSQLLSLRNAMVGLRRAMQRRDYPDAARCLQELKAIEQLMTLDVADKLRMDTIESDLQGIVESHFEQGLRANDRTAIHTYAPLFQAVSPAFEARGLELLLAHVTATLDTQLTGLATGAFSTREQMDHLTTVFNDVAAASNEFDGLTQRCFARVNGAHRLTQTLYALGERCAVAVLAAYMQQRHFRDRMQTNHSVDSATTATSAGSAGSADSSSTSAAAEDAIAGLNEQLNEVALVIQHTQTYERFMRSRVASTAASNESVLPLSHESELGRTVQELAGYYCFFENDLLTRAARKAFQWEELRLASSAASTTTDDDAFSSSTLLAGDATHTFPISSAVDEIFYVARNSGLRALATGHVDCAAGVLNMINTVLRDALGDTMRMRIRNMAAHVKLSSVDEGYSNSDSAGLLGAAVSNQLQQQFAKLSKNMGPIQLPTGGAGGAAGSAATATAANAPNERLRKELGPDVVMNSLETTATYIAQLKREFETELPQDFGADVPSHILTCLSGLEDSSSELQQLLSATRRKLGKLLEPKIVAFLGPLLGMPASTGVSRRGSAVVTYQLTEHMFTVNEANDPFAHQFVASLRTLLAPFHATLSPLNWRHLVEVCAQTTAAVVEQWFASARRPRFNQLGALQFDKDVRVLSAFFAESCDCRAVFAVLAQTATVLSVDTPDDVLDFVGRRARGVEWQLTSARVKEVLARRVEFADAAISSLHLEL